MDVLDQAERVLMAKGNLKDINDHTAKLGRFWAGIFLVCFVPDWTGWRHCSINEILLEAGEGASSPAARNGWWVDEERGWW